MCLCHPTPTQKQNQQGKTIPLMIGNPTVPLHLTSFHQRAIFQAVHGIYRLQKPPGHLAHQIHQVFSWLSFHIKIPSSNEASCFQFDTKFQVQRFQTYCFHFFTQVSHPLIDTQKRVKWQWARKYLQFYIFSFNSFFFISRLFQCSLTAISMCSFLIVLFFPNEQSKSLYDNGLQIEVCFLV